MSILKEQGNLFTHQDTQSGILARFLKFVVRSFPADSNLLQPTEGVNRTPSHVTFSRVTEHISVARDIGSSVLLARIHVSSA